MITRPAKREDIPATEVRSARNHNSSDIERITSTTRIAWILDHLKKKRELLTISIDDVAEPFTSAIVDVDAENGTLVLDELIPRTGNELIIARRRFRITARLDGIKVDFDTTLAEVGEQDGLICFTADLPGLLYYQQRRDFHRVRLPLSYPFRVTLASKDNHVEEGLLRDISFGGAQVILPPESSITARTGTYDCAIELPTGESVYCSVEIRYASVFGRRNEVRTGIRFLDLTPVQKRIIERSVASIEQELLKKLVL
jgi:c-di-GMP-binding flagellar brake protein YcgR